MDDSEPMRVAGSRPCLIGDSTRHPFTIPSLERSGRPRRPSIIDRQRDRSNRSNQYPRMVSPGPCAGLPVVPVLPRNLPENRVPQNMIDSGTSRSNLPSETGCNRRPGRSPDRSAEPKCSAVGSDNSRSRTIVAPNPGTSKRRKRSGGRRRRARLSVCQCQRFRVSTLG